MLMALLFASFLVCLAIGVPVAISSAFPRRSI